METWGTYTARGIRAPPACLVVLSGKEAAILSLLRCSFLPSDMNDVFLLSLKNYCGPMSWAIDIPPQESIAEESCRPRVHAEGRKKKIKFVRGALITVCERRVNLLVYSLSLHRHSYISFILAFASSIRNKQTKSHTHPLLTSSLSLGFPVPRATQYIRGV
jgi:hypothetical protein